MRTLLLIALLLAPITAFAQQPPQEPASALNILQNTIGSLVGQNALLQERNGQLQTEVSRLQAQAAAKAEAEKKKADTPPKQE